MCAKFFFFFFFGLPQDGTVELLPCTAGFLFFCFSWCPSARISHGERRFVEDLVEMPPLADYPSITAYKADDTGIAAGRQLH